MTLWLSIFSAHCFSGCWRLLPPSPMLAAAEIKIMTPRSMWTVLKEIGPEFERRVRPSNSRSIPTSPPTLADRIVGGESFDIFVGPPVQIDRLIKTNKVVADTRTPIARSGIGVRGAGGRVQAGHQHRRRIQARAHEREIDRLSQAGREPAAHTCMDCSIGSESARRSSHKVVRPETDIVSELVAKGEIELGMVVITQIMTTPGVELVGPIPEEIQSYVRWSGAVSRKFCGAGGGEN